jgi:hypothetical protein
MHSTSSGAPAERSTFVTVLAWIFIVLSGFSTIMSIFQYVIMSFVFPFARMQASVDAARARGGIPPGAEFMIGNMRLLIGSFVLLSAIMLVASIGLLKRRNWARRAFIALMALGILWNIGGLFLQRLMFSSMPMGPGNAPPEFRAQFESMMTAMQIASAIFAIAFCVLFGWIIWRLMSADVRREFDGGARP